MLNGTLHRLAAFASPTAGPAGGNPAGVWLGEHLPDSATMLKIAAQLGYSETAFVAPASGTERSVRYFSPLAEVPFCGHATIAAGVALGHATGSGVYRLQTRAGEVPVTVRVGNGTAETSLLSVTPHHVPASEELMRAALAALNWQAAELDRSIAPASAYAGAWHLVLAVAERTRLESLKYDFEQLKALMLRHGLTTLQLIWREHDALFHSRNPFPVGGVTEDPATGAAAAALGGYLRDAGILKAPARFDIRQGEAMGRPSLIRVDVPATGGVAVTGSATLLSPGNGNANSPQCEPVDPRPLHDRHADGAPTLTSVSVGSGADS